MARTRNDAMLKQMPYKGTLPNYFLKINVIMTLRGGGVYGHDTNFSMNFEPFFLITGLELVSTRSYMMSVQTTHVYLPGSTTAASC